MVKRIKSIEQSNNSIINENVYGESELREFERIDNLYRYRELEFRLNNNSRLDLLMTLCEGDSTKVEQLRNTSWVYVYDSLKFKLEQRIEMLKKNKN